MMLCDTRKMRMNIGIPFTFRAAVFVKERVMKSFFSSSFNEILLCSTFGMAGEEHLSYIGAFGELAVQFCRKIICLEF